MNRVSTYFWRLLTEPPSGMPRTTRSVFLALVLLLFGFNLALVISNSLPARSAYRSLLVPTFFILSHLAFQYRWPPWPTLTMRLLAWAWLVFTCCCIFRFVSLPVYHP